MSEFEDDAPFAAALEDCVNRVRAGEPLTVCLQRYPESYREELGRLAATGIEVARLARDPSPAFVGRLEARLRSEIGRERAAMLPVKTGWLRLGWLAGIARVGALMLVGAVAAVAAGPGLDLVSAESLPDSPLYRLKEARETVEVALARAPQAEAVVVARHVEARLAELERAVREDKPRPVVDRVAATLARTTDRVVERTLQLREQGQVRAAERTAAGLQTVRAEVEELAREAGPQARPSLRRLMEVLGEQQRRLETVPAR